jgi:hypothetical protein
VMRRGKSEGGGCSDISGDGLAARLRQCDL